MAKKKKAHKKVRRTIAPRPIQAASSVAGEPISTAAEPAQPPVSPPPEPAGRWSYVSRDLRRVFGLLALCAAIELGLWYLFGHTGLGSWADSLVKL